MPSSTQPNILVVHPSVPAQTVKELIALAKSSKLTYASGGSGSQPHLGGALLEIVGGVDLTHVPYKGSGPGVAAVLGGQVTMMFVGPLAIEGHVRAGKLRALTVADKKRSAILPDVPTAAESGVVPGYEVVTWYGLIAPRGTPTSIIAKLNNALKETIEEPAVRERLVKAGVIARDSSPANFGQHMQAEFIRWNKVREAASIPQI